jgi:hypothetical protein
MDFEGSFVRNPESEIQSFLKIRGCMNKKPIQQNLEQLRRDADAKLMDAPPPRNVGNCSAEELLHELRVSDIASITAIAVHE